MVRFHTVCVNGVITVPTTKLAASPIKINVNNDFDASVEGSSKTPKLDLPISSVELDFEDLEDSQDSPTIVSHSICFSLQHDREKSECVLTKSQASQVVVSRATCDKGLPQLLWQGGGGAE